VVSVGVAYYLGAELGLELSLVGKNVTPLWPPTGIALAAFVLLGRGTWPGVAVAALLVNLPITDSPLAALATAFGNTAAPLLAAAVLGRLGFRRQLDRGTDAIALVFVGALASMVVSATIGTAALVAWGTIPSSEVASAWVVWWTGDAMGVLAVAPFLMSLPLFRELPRWSPLLWLEAGLALALTLASTLWAAQTVPNLLFVPLLVLGWAAWRLQLRGVAPAALAASLVATWSAVHGLGPFEMSPLSEQMLTLQAFNASVDLTSFFLAALVSERNRAATSVATALAREAAHARREHEIAETLQRSLLPEVLPEVPGVAVAARYVPASGDVEVGGDWYDVITLPDGQVGLAIGDVAGHGLAAAATMGQLRMALRAYALQDPSPAAVMTGIHRLVAQVGSREMVTLTYLVLDTATLVLRFSNAGHPPPLVFGPGKAQFLEGALSPPLGVTADPAFTESRHDLERGDTLLLYTDGLVERRGVSIQDGLDRLGRTATMHADAGVGDLCDRLLEALLESARLTDDVALMVLRPVEVGGTLLVVVPAVATSLAQVRAALRRWLHEGGVTGADEHEIMLCCGEACTNVVQHAYPTDPGEIELTAQLVGDEVHLTVRDGGTWRPPADRGGGWGLMMIEELMDDVQLVRTSTSTEVRMVRRLSQRAER
jgi:serine phosphatase RsbU (regulator of sigma subunit)/anti-sigma regulatory factor (Ser/Thr protein kinase)